jgi:type VI secretion system secreted protein VgrG
MDGNPLEAILALAAQKAQEFLEAKAGEAIAAVQSHVQGAVDQALGPISDLTARAESLGNNMQAIQNGDLGAIGGMAADAAGLPAAGDFARSMGGGGDAGPAGGPLSDAVAGGNMITAAANNLVSSGGGAATNLANQAIGGGVGAAHQALASALGVEARGVDGASMENAAGPDGEVGGQDETDRAKGPGHSIGKIAGSHSEVVGGMKITGVLTGIDTNVAGSMTQNAGAAHLEVIIGNRAESAEGSKTESALGLVVLTKGGESETVGGAKTCMVGGAIFDKLKGSHSVEAGAPATFIGAFHKMEAKGAITLKCGASEMVIDGSGITITSPMVTWMGGKIHLPKDVSEV